MRPKFSRIVTRVSVVFVAAFVLADVLSAQVWDAKGLQSKPTALTVTPSTPINAGVQTFEATFASESWGALPATTVFGWFSAPATVPAEGLPAVLCFHGGGERASKNQAEQWAMRGYIALAIDMNGYGADGGPLPDGGVPAVELRKFQTRPISENWIFYWVAASVRAITAIRSHEWANGRIGLHGISWGGFISLIVAGIDDRVSGVVDFYGSAFVYDNPGLDSWLVLTRSKLSHQRQVWEKNLDPSNVLSNVSAPVLLITGTNDWAYPLDIASRTVATLPLGRADFTPGLRHSQSIGETTLRAYAFLDYAVKGSRATFPIVSGMRRDGRNVEVAVTEAMKADSAFIVWTADDTNLWQQKVWASLPITRTQALHPHTWILSGQVPATAKYFFVNGEFDGLPYVSTVVYAVD